MKSFKTLLSENKLNENSDDDYYAHINCIGTRITLSIDNYPSSDSSSEILVYGDSGNGWTFITDDFDAKDNNEKIVNDVQKLCVKFEKSLEKIMNKYDYTVKKKKEFY